MAQAQILAPVGIAIAAMLATPYLMPTGKKADEELTAGASSPMPVSPRLTDRPGTTAFPGADGFGRHAKGGRGGKVIAVTTLADSGPGSLRACIEASGPRTCVFRVSGVIRFTSQRPVIRNPYITIAGQTAPGGGILITHAGGESGYTPIVAKQTHDVVVRHIRVRTDLNGVHRGSNGAFLYESSHDVIFDHVSGAWSLDQIMSGYADNDNITVSNSIFAQGIPRHDKCALLASDPRAPQHLSFVRNLCAHNGDRNPDVNFPPRSCVEIVNNVLYNAMSQFLEAHENFGGTPVSVVGNVFKRGPNSRGDISAIDRVLIASRGESRMFIAGNRLDGIGRLLTPAAEQAVVRQTVCPLASRITSAEDAYREVLARSGAFPRDPLDLQTIEEVRRGKGAILKSPAMLKGPRPLPAIAHGTAYADSDSDGMADRWEQANGATVGKQDMWTDADRDGWSNLDEFLDFAHRSVIANRPVH